MAGVCVLVTVSQQVMWVCLLNRPRIASIRAPADPGPQQWLSREEQISQISEVLSAEAHAGAFGCMEGALIAAFRVQNSGTCIWQTAAVSQP